MRSVRGVSLATVLLAVAIAQQPTIMSNGVHSVANGVPVNPPGSLIYALGTNMATAKMQPLIASSTPLSTRLRDNLDDVSATVNDIPVPMYYALPTIVSFQVPWETNVSTGSAKLVVTRNKIDPNASVAQPAGSVPTPYVGGPATVGDLLYIYAAGLGRRRLGTSGA